MRPAFVLSRATPKFQYPGSAARTFTSIAALPVSAFRVAKTGPQNGNSEDTQCSQIQATPSILSDPGMQRAPLVKEQILNLQALLVGNGAGGGDPNQDSHGDSEQGKRGAVDVRSALQVSKDSLDPQMPFSVELIKVIDACLPVCDVVRPFWKGFGLLCRRLHSDNRQTSRSVAVRGCREYHSAPGISL